MAPLLWAAIGAIGMNIFMERKERQEAISYAQLADVTGVSVGLHCQSFQTVNTERAQLTFMRAYADARMTGYTDPSQIATYVVQTYSPRCLANGVVHSLAELEFYDGIFADVLQEMLDGEVIGEALYEEYLADHQEWVAERSQELQQA